MSDMLSSLVGVLLSAGRRERLLASARTGGQTLSSPSEESVLNGGAISSSSMTGVDGTPGVLG